MNAYNLVKFGEKLEKFVKIMKIWVNLGNFLWFCKFLGVNLGNFCGKCKFG